MAKKTKKSTRITKSSAKRQHPKHFLKVYWPYIPVIAVVVFSMVFGNVYPGSRINNPATLAYATEMGAASLLSETNAKRAENGLGALKLNSKLNASAQAKANDMASRDYWSHNTPDGKEPWVFIDATGYAYQKAGENLAYGFSTSSATVVGWMNSPSHRANILDTSYPEVGFGFINAENFTGTGQQTIVVAHYGQPINSTPPPPAPTPTPTPVSSSKPATQSATKTSPSPEPVPEPTPAPEPTTASEPVITQDDFSAENSDETPVTTATPVPESKESTNITRIQRLTGGKAPWSALAISVISFAVVTIWLIKHAVLVKRFVLQGEHFVAHHPILDILIVAVAALAVYLSQFAGVVL